MPSRRAFSRMRFSVRNDSANGLPLPGRGTPIAHTRLTTGITARRTAGSSIGFSTDAIWSICITQIIPDRAALGS